MRHDVYLGLVSGGKGVVIWSLFRRGGVKRTWQRWYDAYAECGRELNGPRGLSQVFLFGKRQATLKIELSQGTAAANVALGGDVEPTTTTKAERAARAVKLPTWSAAELAYDAQDWLFLVNSGNEPATFVVVGFPQQANVSDAFTDAARPLAEHGRLQVRLDAYGVAALRIAKAGR